MSLITSPIVLSMYMLDPDLGLSCGRGRDSHCEHVTLLGDGKKHEGHTKVGHNNERTHHIDDITLVTHSTRGYRPP